MTNNTFAEIETVQNRHAVTTSKAAPRNAEAQAQLDKLEAIIDDRLQSSFELASALAKIHDDELFRPEYKTFEEYCKKRWDYSRSYCHRLRDVDGVLRDLKELPETISRPKNEAQARLYVNLEKDERIELAEKVAEEVGGKEPTATLIAQYKRDLFPEKCAGNSKQDTSTKPVIDVEAKVEVVADKPDFIKTRNTIIKLQHLMLTEERQGVLGALIDELSECIKTWLNESKPKAIQGA